jgi:phenylpropionate dioxygenase-like ring-hydroxylating dioxygenase large terminal subunit
MEDESYDFPYPPFPNGWHGIAFADEVGLGEVKPVRMLGRDFVVFRGDDGEARVFDAFCPHLGAHLGHGGRVEGNELVCPFHNWRWAGDGSCAGIPYAERIPPNAKIGTWRSVERNGFIFVWYHAKGAEPDWEIEEIPETRDAEFQVVARRDWEPFRSHPQEIAENGVDLPHFRVLHGWTAKSIDWKTDGPVYDMEYEIAEMPERWTQADAEPYSLQSRTEGPSYTRTRFWGAYRGVSSHCFTPVEAGKIRLMQLYYGHESQTEEESDRWFQASDREWAADIPIWNAKRHLAEPMLTGEDGPVPVFRRWFSQFYSE